MFTLNLHTKKNNTTICNIKHINKHVVEFRYVGNKA